MAQVALGRLARAVSDAGGLGTIGIGADDPLERIASEAAIARGGDDGRFGIGMMAWALERRPELFDAVLAERPFLVSISFGDVAPYVERARRAGCRIAAQVQTRVSALAAEAAGVDLIVVQGTEAGGHTGFVGTLPLLQIVLDAVRTPVVAAGGIATARGVAAVLAAGADGAWIGTPLLASPESAASPEARAAVVAAREDQTVLTSLFDRVQGIPWPAQFPGRALANEFTARFHGREDEALADADALASYADARRTRDFRTAHLYAGQSVGTIERERNAGDIIRELGDETEALLKTRFTALGTHAFSPGYHEIENGDLANVATSLEMREQPAVHGHATNASLGDSSIGTLTLRHVVAPDSAWYRDLYRRVGRDYLWTARLAMPEAELRAILDDPLVDVYALVRDGEDAGLLELDFRTPGECELVYFGVANDSIGTGAGQWLIERAIERAWSRPIHRFWLHTCTFDHPRALAFYRRNGFVPFKREIEIFADPRATGIYQQDAAPNIPLLL
jgi:nitronate monooxygenase